MAARADRTRAVFRAPIFTRAVYALWQQHPQHGQRRRSDPGRPLRSLQFCLDGIWRRFHVPQSKDLSLRQQGPRQTQVCRTTGRTGSPVLAAAGTQIGMRSSGPAHGFTRLRDRHRCLMAFNSNKLSLRSSVMKFPWNFLSCLSFQLLNRSFRKKALKLRRA